MGHLSDYIEESAKVLEPPSVTTVLLDLDEVTAVRHAINYLDSQSYLALRMDVDYLDHKLARAQKRLTERATRSEEERAAQ